MTEWKTVPEGKPNSYLTFTLHAHLPYVVNHGTWPHGLEWLLEAAAETYLPLLRMFGRLERDGIALHCNLNLSPILLEQLAHPTFRAEFPAYVERKINAAQEDEWFFGSIGDQGFAETARFWQQYYRESLEQFRYLEGDITKSFLYFHEKGFLDILTSGATHGYMPLLGTDESLRAQVRTAVEAHKHHLGIEPRGIWVPECGYRPSGTWKFPVAVPGQEDAAESIGTERIGVEQALAESGLEFFFVDTHLVEGSAEVRSPYGPSSANPPRQLKSNDRTLYQPYYVAGPYTGMKPFDSSRQAPTVFPRDPHTGLQVWSGEYGYPGDAVYLDFHKKRWPGGHRYWRVTGPQVDMGDKQPYRAQEAQERVHAHAAHFLSLVHSALEGCLNTEDPPILTAPFDAELFGHWWFEGPLWLEAVARQLHESPEGLALISCAEYLDKYPRAGFITMPEGSWGAEGNNQVWLNDETAWTYEAIYTAELTTRKICTGDAWRRDATGERVVKQLCRELLLLESSDWQFLITTGAARDYAEMRFTTHRDQFNELAAMWNTIEGGAALNDSEQQRLVEIEQRDSIFAAIDPSHWAMGAHADPADAKLDVPQGPGVLAMKG
ncbi:MAG: 1,4-alpha-glucan branching protein domain-containing protein [Bryocella sp.]